VSAATPLPAPAPEPAPVSAAACPTVDDLAAIRADLVVAQNMLDDLVWILEDATSHQPVCTVEAQRADVDRHGAELRAVLQLCAAKVDAITALVRLAEDQRARNRAALRKAGGQ
jgi:hypothetical protein